MTFQVNDLDHRDAAPVVSPFTKVLGQAVYVPSVYETAGKRILDITLVLASLPVVLPVILLMAALVALDGHNPFYSQNRVGRFGQIFRIYKLRTMIPNAKASLEDYLAKNQDARQEWEVNQKLRNDPRITRIGQFLRRSSLDELPQLFNVLLGDMSLVGPRPMMIEQTPLYPSMSYYMLRPGVTGSWQVSERNASTFAARAGFDTEYSRSISFWLDIKILMRTILVVVRGTGC
ncbi:sugar transferase [Seohaeicola zhoushanensis]|uniref:Sugar transferase n=1 Tax=Seohaeicola zhoushanensis TaxID=1569283 RepID=A0A8J3GUH4_9RHOB|nr:sugar transferase [Seohaeicola zhoushanensis]GHF36687.1 sugar transferase [Seohaeicola zhoushanensis]